MNLSQLEEIVNQLQKIPLSNVILEKDAAGLEADPETVEEKKVIRTPKFRISESWGDPNSIDRAVIRRIAANLETLDVKSMIAYVQEFQQAAGDKQYTVAEILSNLMFLEAFQSLLFDFNASTSGFLFEALLAGVMGGYQIPAEGGTTPADVGGIPVSGRFADAIGKQTDEMMEEYRKNPKDGGGTRIGDVSLKLLAQGGEVKGSYHNLVRAFAPEPNDRDPLDREKPMQAVEKMTYVVVEKVQPEDKNLKELTLNFYEFDITLDNWFDIIGHRKMEKGRADIKMTWKREIKEWQPGQPNDFDRDEDGKPTSLNARETTAWTAVGEPVVVPEVPEPEEGQKPVVRRPIDYAKELDPPMERITKHLFKVVNVADPSEEYTGRDVLPPGEYQMFNKQPAFLVSKALQKAFNITLADGKTPAVGALDPAQTYLVSAKVGDDPVAERSSHFKHLYGDKGDEIESMLSAGAWAEMPREDKIAYLKGMKSFERKKSAEKGGTQFHISSKFHKSLNGGKTLIGTLDISSSKLKRAAEKYADDLGGKVVDIFNSLGDVIDNINNYFLGEEGQKQQFGADAITNAKTLRKTTEQYISEADDGFTPVEKAFFASDAPLDTDTYPSENKVKQLDFLDQLIEQAIDKRFN